MQDLVKKYGWTYDCEGAFDINGIFAYQPGFILDPTGDITMPYQKNEEAKLSNDGWVDKTGWCSNLIE